MAEKKKIEFLLLRYMPDAVKGEFVNFGLMAIENGPDGAALIDVRFTRDWGRVLYLDPEADVEMLAALQREIQQEVGRKKDELTLLKRMEDSFSGMVQVSPIMPALTQKTAAIEIADVAKIFLETAKVRRMREPAGRQKILGRMRSEFEKAGVLPFVNAVPAEPYTKPGDPFEFDFGYRFGGEIKLFHAVSMRASIDSAVMLAARYPKILAVMSQITGTTPVLMAVVDDDLDRSADAVQFALSMMQDEKIQIAVAAEMPLIAEVARRELRV